MERSALVTLEQASFVYQAKTPFARPALRGVDLEVRRGSVTAVVGSTAAGKSTLLQLVAGLLKPTAGARTGPPGGQIGMVFQRPEAQLFASTVFEDVAVGPTLHGCPADRVPARVEEALGVVGLDPEVFGSRRPYTLSLGEQRRVATAGVLASDPRLLVLDEPGAGLDPRGRRDVMRRMVGWSREAQADRTLVFTSHDLDEVAGLADEVVVLSGGAVLGRGTPGDMLGSEAILERAGLHEPLAARVARRLGLSDDAGGALVTPAALAAALQRARP